MTAVFGKKYFASIILLQKNIGQLYSTADLPSNANAYDLMANWDKIWSKDKAKMSRYADLCGCILPNSPDILAAPNGRRFISRPADHASNFKAAHAILFKKTKTATSETSSSTIQSLFASAGAKRKSQSDKPGYEVMKHTHVKIH